MLSQLQCLMTTLRCSRPKGCSHQNTAGMLMLVPHQAANRDTHACANVGIFSVPAQLRAADAGGQGSPC